MRFETKKLQFVVSYLTSQISYLFYKIRDVRFETRVSIAIGMRLKYYTLLSQISYLTSHISFTIRNFV